MKLNISKEEVIEAEAEAEGGELEEETLKIILIPSIEFTLYEQ